MKRHGQKKIPSTLTKGFLRILYTLPEEISASKFPAVHKILMKQLPTNVLPGFLRNIQCNPQENQEFLVVQEEPVDRI